MVDVCKEAASIRVAMSKIGWDYTGGGPYPHNPTLSFARGAERIKVTVGEVSTAHSKEPFCGAVMSHVCETCGQATHERPPRPLDMIDQLYLAFGKCCAGCDYWKHEPIYTRPLGHCQKKPIDTVTAFDIDGPGSVVRFKTYERTEAKFVCPMFQDTFDWTQLGVENPLWLKEAEHG